MRINTVFFHLSITVNMLCIVSSDHRGIEWISLSGFISFATSTPNNLGLVRNELQLVDLPTGWCFLRHLQKRLSDLLRSHKQKLLILYFVMTTEGKKKIKRNVTDSVLPCESQVVCSNWCYTARFETIPLQRFLWLGLKACMSAVSQEHPHNMLVVQLVAIYMYSKRHIFPNAFFQSLNSLLQVVLLSLIVCCFLSLYFCMV